MSQFEQIRRDWDDMADINAVWFNTPNEHLSKDLAVFFDSGKSHLKKDLELIDSLNIAIKKDTALDFGCGVGRITQALAEEFETCYGVDISEKMIEAAQQYNRFGSKCQYIANAKTDLAIFKNEFFNFIFSTNALQHNPPEVIKNYLLEFLRILKSGGVITFQIPVERLTKDDAGIYIRSLPKFHPKRIWNKLRGILIGHDNSTRYYRLRKLGFPKKWLNERLGLHPNIYMYFMDEKSIREILESHGGMIRHIEKFEYKDMVHAEFVVVKKA